MDPEAQGFRRLSELEAPPNERLVDTIAGILGINPMHEIKNV